LQHESVSGEPDKEAYTLLVEFSPGASTGRHFHPGDEYAAVVDGELQLNVDGQPTRIAKSGEGYHNTAGSVHESKNVSSVPARVVSTLIVERGKPISVSVE
jgi:quercetin dioxygenase-like cupin family protein